MEKSQARSRLKSKKEPYFQKYLHFVHCFFIALLTYFLLYLLLSKIYPHQIQNFIFTNSYLPFFLLLFLANFFLFTFLFLNKKIGLSIAFSINLLLYCKINHLLFNWSNVLIIALLIFSFLLLIWLEKIIKPKQK